MPLLFKKVSYDQLIKDGCQLAGGMPALAFGALARIALDDPCTTGCFFFDRGTCPAYLRHHTKPTKQAAEAAERKAADLKRTYSDTSGLIGGKWTGKPIKTIAREEGISLNQARENKRNGLYKGE